MKESEGIITPAVSPFREGQIDREGIWKLMCHLHRIKVSGIFPMGSTGAFPLVTSEVHKKISGRFLNSGLLTTTFYPGWDVTVSKILLELRSTQRI